MGREMALSMGWTEFARVAAQTLSVPNPHHLRTSGELLYNGFMEADAHTKTLALITRKGLIRPRDVEAAGLLRSSLYELLEEGKLVKVERGLYTLPDFPITERHSYAQATKVVPHGVICLLSALRFHGLTMENPAEVWVSIPRGTWRPGSKTLQLRFVQCDPKRFAAGVETHRVEGVDVRVTSVARTIADCFKCRNQIGINVAVEALRDAIRRKHLKLDDLWRHAKALRLTRVLLPYLETLT
jgi:predicted transcriptional regulator of viral defense system